MLRVRWMGLRIGEEKCSMMKEHALVFNFNDFTNGRFQPFFAECKNQMIY